jgi:hypothetical protein
MIDSGPAGVIGVSGGGLVGVACPATSQCTAVDHAGAEVTFDPSAPGTPVVTTIDASDSAALSGVACPSISQCTAVGAGVEATFDPTAPGAVTPATIDSASVSGVSCPAANQCTTVDSTGDEVTFDPTAPGTPVPVAIDSGYALDDVSCVSATQCTTIDYGRELTFDPSAAAASPLISIDTGPDGLACASATECTAVGYGGLAATFNPRAPGSPSPTLIDGGSALSQVACPASTQCTAIDTAGREVTFNPSAPGTPTPVAIDSQFVNGLACPAVSQCTAVDEGGREVTFNPTDPGSPIPTTVDGGGGNVLTSAVACPSVTQCTAIDFSGHEATFNPTSPGSPSRVSLGTTSDLEAVACPSATDCIAMAGGQVVTFDPAAPGTPTPTAMSAGLTGLACPSTSQCTVVADGPGGEELTFDPAAAGSPTSLMTDGDSNAELFGVACASVTECNAVDYLGRAVTFDPEPPAVAGAVQTIPGAVGLDAIGCSTSGQCVAVDRVGDAFLGVPVAEASAPANTSLPLISGTATQGQTLTETNGTWSNSPTSFSYRWEDCDTSGSACSAIAGATAQTYALAAADVGSTIRVVETASNAAGAGSPASSAQTAVVVPLPPAITSVPGISGTVTQGQTLTETHGAWSNSPTSYGYQWEDCDSSGNGCSAVTGATAQTYVLAAGDVGHTLRVQETASNAGGSSSPASSSQSGVVQALPVGPASATAPADRSAPTVTGTATVGSTLSASTGTWSGTAPISYAYQWQRCNPGCANIAGASGASYTLSTADLGAQVRVVITASNSAGSAAAASASSATVTAITPAAPTAAQIKTLLLKEITPTGKATTIAALLKAGGDTISFKALSAGTAVVDWYYVPAGAHIAKAKPKAQLVAGGRLTFAAAGTGKLKIKLTAAGKKLLKGEKSGHAKLLKLTAKATFTTASRNAIVTSETFTPTK